MINFLQQKKIRFNILMPSGSKGLMNLVAHKDGSFFLTCSRKLLNVDKYTFGVVVMKPGVESIQTYQLNKEEGFVETDKVPKITFHTDGYIHASLSDGKDSNLSRRVKMDLPLGLLQGKQIGTMEWSNLVNYEDSPSTKKEYHVFNIQSKIDINYLHANLKVSYNIHDLLGESKNFSITLDDKKIQGMPDVEHMAQDLEDGNFIILPIPIFNNNQVIFHNNNNSIIGKYPMVSILFGIKDNSIQKGKIIWYLLNFINPNDTKMKLESNTGSFLFSGAMKNWEVNKLRETGEKVIIRGMRN